MDSLKKRWNITPLLKSDVESIACFHQKCFEDPWSDNFFKSLTQNVHVFGFLARDVDSKDIKGLIVGQVCQGTAEIYTLATHPQNRRQGIATILIEKLIVLCITHLIENIFIEVNENNASALMFYKNLGFISYGKRSKYYLLSNNNFADAVLLQLRINKN
ncbi:MAG: GNAT family N-acetyltransferase [Janthinobacterium lividum]